MRIVGWQKFGYREPRSVERNEPANFATPEECLGVEDQEEGPDPREGTESLEDTADSVIPLSRQPFESAYLSTLQSLGPIPFQRHKNIPSIVKSFSDAFIRETIGGTHVTFTRVGCAMARKQIVPWPALIRVNPENHEFAPRLRNDYGALTLVEGRFTEDKDPCNTGSTLPVVIREAKDAFQYIGHYTIATRKQISVAEWKGWSKQRRDSIVQEMRSKWGNEVLLRNRLQVCDDWPNSASDQIHGFFERETEPNLRMCLAILKFHSFNQDDYYTLVSEASRRMRKAKKTAAPSPFSRAQFEPAFREWMGCFHWEPHQRFKFAVRGQGKRVSATVLQRGEDAQMFGKEYQMGHPNTQFKHFIWELALELSAKFPLGTMGKDEDVIQFLSVVAQMFDDHNKNKLRKMTRTAGEPYSNLQTHAHTAVSMDTQQQGLQNVKRERLDDCWEAAISKRPRLDTCIPETRVAQIAQPRDYLLNDEIVPHAAIMNSSSVRDSGRSRVTLSGLAKSKNVAAARARILQHWPKPLPASWISRKDSVSFLEAVRPVAATMSFENAVRQINCAIIQRLRQTNDKNVPKTPSPTSADFRNIVRCHHIPSMISPQLLAEFGLREGPEGFLEKDSTSAVASTKLGNSCRSAPPNPLLHGVSEDLYDASPRR